MQPIAPSNASYISVTGVRTNPRDNFTSTRDTIQIMRRVVWESLNHSSAQAVGQVITSTLPSTASDEDVARACYWWVKNHITLREDEDTLRTDFDIDPGIEGKELLLSPAYVLSLPTGTAVGDCDDFSTTLATLMMRLGIPHQHIFFCTVAADHRQPNAFSHVYLTMQLAKGGALPLDCSHGPIPGWEVSNVTKKAYWSV